MNRTILVVEDHQETRDLIKAALEHEGFKVNCKGTVNEGKDFLKQHRPAFVILDLALPDGCGLEVCGLVRGDPRLSKTPVIALTGLGEFEDKKRGFAAGVDQYLVKPLEVEELLLWVRALLRRVDWDASGRVLPVFGDLQICAETYLVKFRNKVIGNLTRREFDLLYFLVATSPKLISRQGIIAKVWRTAAVENLVDTHIHNLRQKLPPLLAARIQSVAGKGFRYLKPG